MRAGARGHREGARDRIRGNPQFGAGGVWRVAARVRPATMTSQRPLNADELRGLDAYWRAANYLSVGQIYLLDNPLLREPLRARARQAAAARPLGHDAGAQPPLRAPEPGDPAARPATRSTSPGPATAARASSRTPGSRAPTRELYPDDHARRGRACAAVPAVLVPGRHPEPRRAGDAGLDPRGRRARLRARARLRRRVRQPRPASSAAWSATARRRPGPLAASWHSNKFLDPARDGAVLPILHLNGYKIANPTVLARIPRGRAARAARGLRPRAAVRRGRRPRGGAPGAGRGARRRARRDPRRSRSAARSGGQGERPRWPMIVLRTPKGWTGPEEVDGVPVEGTWRSHQVPLSGLARQPGAPARSSRSGCARYRPEELFDEDGRPRRRASLALAPRGRRGAWAPTRTPTAASCCATCELPDFRDYAVDVPAPGRALERGDAGARRLPARRDARQPATRSASSAPTRRRRTGSAPSSRSTDRAWMAERCDRRRPPRARRARDGGPAASTCARAGWRATC